MKRWRVFAFFLIFCVQADEKDYQWLNDSAYYQKGRLQEALKQELVRDVFFGSEVIFSGKFFKRQSKKIIIVVPPMFADLSKQIRFAGVVDKACDVLLLESPWTPKKAFKETFLYGFSPLLRKSQESIKEAYLWADANGYEQIFGLGLCYGGWLIAEVQKKLEKNNQKGFDKIILDSVPISIGTLGLESLQNPCEIFTAGYVKTPQCWYWIGCGKLLTRLFSSSINYFSPQESLAVLSETSAKILIIVSENDPMVTISQINKVLQNLNDDFILKFSGGHLHAHLKHKERYAMEINKFLNA